MLAFFFYAFVAYAVYYVISFYRSAAKLPPGPIPFPLIGNLISQIRPPFIFRDLQRIAKDYGGMYTVHIPFPIINISDYQTIKTVLKGDDFTGRWHTEINDMLNFTKNGGIIQSDGEVWKEQRRATISILRDFGMGRNLMEEKVYLSAGEYIACLKSKKDKDRVDMRWPVQLFVANVISDLLFAKRYPGDDCQELMNFADGIVRFFTDASDSKLFLAGAAFPFLKHVPFVKEYAYDIHKRNWNKLQEYIRKQVDLARSTFNEEDDPVSFTHAYMKAMETNNFLNEEQLYDCCKDLFLAGQETTTTTLRWAMLFMAAHQDVQDKVRAEICSVIGSTGGKLLMKDKARMPYTSATILELQRCANIIPFNMGIVHRATVDTTINGISVPKDTIINPDLHQVHACDPHFKDPERFCPDRYLMEDGKTLNKDLVDRTIPFGLGKRMCAGEGIARVELFVGLTSTIMNFKVLPPLNGVVDLTPQYLNVHLPQNHELRLVPLY